MHSDDKKLEKRTFRKSVKIGRKRRVLKKSKKTCTEVTGRSFNITRSGLTIRKGSSSKHHFSGVANMTIAGKSPLLIGDTSTQRVGIFYCHSLVFGGFKDSSPQSLECKWWNSLGGTP